MLLFMRYESERGKPQQFLFCVFLVQYEGVLKDEARTLVPIPSLVHSRHVSDIWIL